MKAVVQRVKRSSVTIDGKVVGEIGQGLMVLLGVSEDDTERECDYLADKIAGLRIFEDGAGKMNRSLLDIQGEMLIVSQFTLCADCRKGRRPVSYTHLDVYKRQSLHWPFCFESLCAYTSFPFL